MIQNDGDFSILGSLNNEDTEDTDEKKEEKKLDDIKTEALLDELQRRWLWNNSFTRIN